MSQYFSILYNRVSYLCSPMKHIYIDYPKTVLWEKLSWLYTTMTYLSIITVVVWSCFKKSDFYTTYVLISEVIFSFFFLIDYWTRLYLSKFSWKFIKNPFSITDLLSFAPLFIWVLAWLPRYSETFNIFRLCRILRLFRVWKYRTFLKELWNAVQHNLYKYNIAFTLFFIVWLIWSFVIYSVENGKNAMFANIPDAMWWAVVTMATLWYWDKVPITILGKMLSVFIIIFGPIFLSIITSITIVTFLDVIRHLKKDTPEDYTCENCLTSWHTTSDNYCKNCGTKLYR